MALTPRTLNRATLARQLLLGREPIGVGEGVRWVGALQAQEPTSPYVALWNRLDGFDPGDLDVAFADREVVRASLMRITLHAVHADDYPAFHAAMVPSLRASRLNDRRYLTTGLTADDADAVLPHLLAGLTDPRSAEEIEELLADRRGRREQRLWWALRTFAPLPHAPTGPPWSFGGRSSFVAAGTDGVAVTPEEGAQRLVLRYLEAFGPASRHDIAQFTILRQPAVRDALEARTDRVEEVEGPDGEVLVDVPGSPVPPEDTVAPPRLLPMWDSILLAYADRSRVIPPDYSPLVIPRNGDVLPTLLVDGYVAGVWRPVDGGIEVTAFHHLNDNALDGFEAEAHALAAFLANREPTVYRRYARWWDELPGEQVRVFAHDAATS
jgi:hypothetical protein